MQLITNRLMGQPNVTGDWGLMSSCRVEGG